MSQVDLAVVGLGMVSSVGRDVANSCAAIRAGVTRPKPLDSFESVGVVSDDGESVIGHRIVGVTEGFSFLGLWVRLADFAIHDLVAYSRLTESDSTFWRRTAILCVTPVIEPRRFLIDEDPESLLIVFADILREVIDLPVRDIEVIPEGQIGVALAVDRAHALLSAGAADRVIIVAVDCLADVHSVDWLAKMDRLKTGERPSGLAPGEAGACVLVETSARAQARSAPVEGLIRQSSISSAEVEPSSRPSHYQGKVLADAIRPLLVTHEPFRGDIYSDLNGEVWRAQEFGNASVLLRAQLADEATWHFPATSIGDTGAASGVIALCLGVRSFVRRYSKQDRVLITCLSERGRGAAVAIDRE